MADEKEPPTIIVEATGEEISEDEKASLRHVLKTRGVDALMLPPEMEAQMAKNGITKEDILEAMLKAASNKLQ